MKQVLLMLFSWSDHWRLLDITVATIDLPKPIQFLGHVFRSSGRFFWPVAYLLLLLGIVLVWRSIKCRYALILAWVCLCLQLIDLTPLYANFHFLSAKYRAVKLSPGWCDAMGRVNHILFLDRLNKRPLAISFARLAERHHATINAEFESRLDFKARRLLVYKQLSLLKVGRVSPDTLYVFKNRQLLPADIAADLELLHLNGVYGLKRR